MQLDNAPPEQLNYYLLPAVIVPSTHVTLPMYMYAIDGYLSRVGVEGNCCPTLAPTNSLPTCDACYRQWFIIERLLGVYGSAQICFITHQSSVPSLLPAEVQHGRTASRVTVQAVSAAREVAVRQWRFGTHMCGRAESSRRVALSLLPSLLLPDVVAMMATMTAMTMVELILRLILIAMRRAVRQCQLLVNAWVVVRILPTDGLWRTNTTST